MFNYVILAPGACEGRPPAAVHDPVSRDLRDPEDPRENFQPLIPFESVLKKSALRAPIGRYGHILLFGEIKAPAGALKTRICIFEGQRSPCGSAKDTYL